MHTTLSGMSSQEIGVKLRPSCHWRMLLKIGEGVWKMIGHIQTEKATITSDWCNCNMCIQHKCTIISAKYQPSSLLARDNNGYLGTCPLRVL